MPSPSLLTGTVELELDKIPSTKKLEVDPVHVQVTPVPLAVGAGEDSSGQVTPSSSGSSSHCGDVGDSNQNREKNPFDADVPDGGMRAWLVVVGVSTRLTI